MNKKLVSTVLAVLPVFSNAVDFLVSAGSTVADKNEFGVIGVGVRSYIDDRCGFEVLAEHGLSSDGKNTYLEEVRVGSFVEKTLGDTNLSWRGMGGLMVIASGENAAQYQNNFINASSYVGGGLKWNHEDGSALTLDFLVAKQMKSDSQTSMMSLGYQHRFDQQDS